jgi:hypothetical protein
MPHSYNGRTIGKEKNMETEHQNNMTDQLDLTKIHRTPNPI